MGSHYIPVGKLKIDKEILDIACPAAGYYPDDPFSEEPETPESISEGEFVFLVDNSMSSRVGFFVSGDYTISLTELDGTIIKTFDKSSGATTGWTLDNSTYKQWHVRVTGRNGQEISTIRRIDTWTPETQPILWAWIKATSSLTSLSSFMYGVKSFKGVTLDGDFSGLTSFKRAFYGTSIEQCTIPTYMPSLTEFTEMFAYSKIRKVTMENIVVDKNTTFQYMFYQTPLLKKIDISVDTEIETVASAFYRFAEYSNVEEVIMDINIIGNGEAQNFANVTGFCSNLKKFYSPYFNGTFALISNFGNCVKLQEIHIRGTSLITSSLGIFNVPSLKQIHFDIETFTGSTFVSSDLRPYYSKNYSLDIATYPTNSIGFDFSDSNTPSITKITGTFSYLESGSTFCSINFPSRTNLREINAPNLALRHLVLGKYYLGYPIVLPITQVILDFANSSFSSSGDVVIICQIDATEINRIFSELPAMTKTIDVRGCPGYSGCDKSIAQAKGWTVR